MSPPPGERNLTGPAPRRPGSPRRLLHVTAVQMTARPDDPAANLARGVGIVREAAAQGADLVLFPELWQVRTEL